MRKKFQIRTLLAVGTLCLGLYACSSDEGSDSPVVPPLSGDDPSSSDSQPGSDNPGSSSAIEIDTVRKIVNGDTIFDTVHVVVPKDTTPHWVGNSALRITEISPLNLSWMDESGEDPAWVEIYNAGDVAANLKGYALVESLEKPRKWVFGDELIAAKSFRIVFCDKKNITEVKGADNGDMHARTHTSWKMDKAGGTVYLIDAAYGIRDSVAFPEITKGDLSWGITDGGIWKYFDKPTPEKPNTGSTAYDALAPELDLSQIKGGFYNEPVTINPPSLPSGVKLRCTEDGSVPGANSQEFNSAKTFDKNTTLRCAVFKDGSLSTQVVTKTFFVGEHVNMPVVAVSVNPDFFNKHYIQPSPGSTNASSPEAAPSGLYEDVEFPVHVEYFPNGSSSDKSVWDIEAGISMMGNYSRLERKKSVAIVMREEYQDGWLHYSLFDTRKSENDKYKGFNLRNNGNRFVSDYFADALGGAILEGSGVDYQRSRQVVVFYNGKYFGIHDMRERFNKNYVESNYGIEASTVTMVKHLTETVTASNGTPDEYISMLELAADNDFSGDNNAFYAQLKTMMDVGNFADYMAAEMYIHNGDWPNNNVRAWRSPDNMWKFMIYDLDHGFNWDWNVAGFGQSTNMFDWVKQGGRSRHAFGAQRHGKMAGSIDETEAERDLAANGQKERGYGSFTVSNSSITEWARQRDIDMLQQYKSEFGLGEMVNMTILSNGNGSVLMEGMNLPGSTATSTKYTGKFFSGNQMEVTAVPSNGAVFTGWSDGSTDNPHLVNITEGQTITANFK